MLDLDDGQNAWPAMANTFLSLLLIYRPWLTMQIRIGVSQTKCFRAAMKLLHTSHSRHASYRIQPSEPTSSGCTTIRQLHKTLMQRHNNHRLYRSNRTDGFWEAIT